MSNLTRGVLVVCAALFGGVLSICLRNGDPAEMVVYPAVGVTFCALAALAPWKDAALKEKPE